MFRRLFLKLLKSRLPPTASGAHLRLLKNRLPAAPPAAESPSGEEASTGSQWIPVEEETFAFEEETADEQPAPAVDVPEPTVEESAFGDDRHSEPPLL